MYYPIGSKKSQKEFYGSKFYSYILGEDGVEITDILMDALQNFDKVPYTQVINVAIVLVLVLLILLFTLICLPCWWCCSCCCCSRGVIYEEEFEDPLKEPLINKNIQNAKEYNIVPSDASLNRSSSNVPLVNESPLSSPTHKPSPVNTNAQKPTAINIASPKKNKKPKRKNKHYGNDCCSCCCCCCGRVTGLICAYFGFIASILAFLLGIYACAYVFKYILFRDLLLHIQVQ